MIDADRVPDDNHIYCHPWIGDHKQPRGDTVDLDYNR